MIKPDPLTEWRSGGSCLVKVSPLRLHKGPEDLTPVYSQGMNTSNPTAAVILLGCLIHENVPVTIFVRARHSIKFNYQCKYV